MAGRGPAPKPASQRRRKNAAPQTTTLRVVEVGDAPSVPFEVHPLTSAWWRDVWSSPMAAEWDESDKHGLFMLARLVDAFWTAESPTQAKDLAGEIRLQSQRFGLSPVDRQRLRWEIERGDEAEKKTQRRRAAAGPKAVRKDPRSA